MSLKIFFSQVLLITALAACNNNSVDPDFNYQKSTPLISSADTLKDTAHNVLPAIHTQDKNQSPSLIPTKSNTVNKNLNPEHGQPGHRCDIAVGAPLDSKPSAITRQIQPVTNETQTVVNPKNTIASGMNPPHGKPGHRCDIAVGSPLSQPVKKDNAEQHIKTISPVKDSTKN